MLRLLRVVPAVQMFISVYNCTVFFNPSSVILIRCTGGLALLVDFYVKGSLRQLLSLNLQILSVTLQLHL